MAASTQTHPLAQAGGFAHAGDCSNDVACLRAKVTLPADFEINDKFDLLKLPAEHRIVGATLISADLDGGGPTVTLDVGIIDTVQDPSDTTDVDAIFAASTVAQAGGVVQATLATAFNVAVRNYERTVRLAVKAAATTPQSGDVELLLFVSPKLANGWDSAVVMPT